MTQKAEQRRRSEAGHTGENPSTPVVISGGGIDIWPISIGLPEGATLAFTVLAPAPGGRDGWLQSEALNVGPIKELRGTGGASGVTQSITQHPTTLEFRNAARTLFTVQEVASGQGSYNLLITVVDAVETFVAKNLAHEKWTTSHAGLRCDRVFVNGQGFPLDGPFEMTIDFAT